MHLVGGEAGRIESRPEANYMRGEWWMIPIPGMTPQNDGNCPAAVPDQLTSHSTISLASGCSSPTDLGSKRCVDSG